MTGADAISYIEYLVAIGFAPPNREGSPEVALINRDTGLVWPCDWLELGEAGRESVDTRPADELAQTREKKPEDTLP